MKKAIYPLLLLLLLPVFTACDSYDYTSHLSDIRSDIFLAETDEFTVTLSCISREYPFVSDGVASDKTDMIEITLTGEIGENFEVYVLDDQVWGGDMSFRNATSDYYYSRGVKSFPEGNVSLRITWNEGEETREITATSIKNAQTLTVEQALDYAVTAERETVTSLTSNGEFCGEFYVRLLRRDKNYYYVGIVATDGTTVSLLLDSETGAVLARRVTGK